MVVQVGVVWSCVQSGLDRVEPFARKIVSGEPPGLPGSVKKWPRRGRLLQTTAGLIKRTEERRTGLGCPAPAVGMARKCVVLAPVEPGNELAGEETWFVHVAHRRDFHRRCVQMQTTQPALEGGRQARKRGIRPHREPEPGQAAPGAVSGAAGVFPGRLMRRSVAPKRERIRTNRNSGQGSATSPPRRSFRLCTWSGGKSLARPATCRPPLSPVRGTSRRDGGASGTDFGRSGRLMLGKAGPRVLATLVARSLLAYATATKATSETAAHWFGICWRRLLWPPRPSRS